MLIFLGFSATAGDCSSDPCRLQNSKEIFQGANQLYKEGKYQEAASEYEKIIGANKESGCVYFNLGNCFFKTGEMGKALLNYERAARLIPRDADLRFNAALARAKVSGYDWPMKRRWIYRLSDSCFKNLTVDELTLFLSILYCGSLVILAAGFFLTTIQRAARFILPVFFFLISLGIVSAYDKISRINHEAVITAKQVVVKFEPFEKATTFFELSEGAQVDVLEKKEGWTKVRRPDNKAGWVKAEGLEII